MEKKKKTILRAIMVAAILAILIAGTLMIVFAKFHFSLDYAAHQRIEVFIGKNYDTKEIEAMVKEVLGNRQADVRDVEVFHDMVAIETKEMTEDEQNQLLQKINEKYGTELIKEEAITVYNVPAYRIWDMLTPYFLPSAIIGLLVLIYAGARYAKLGVFKILGKTLGLSILFVALYTSIIAILRVPLGPAVIPVGFALGILTMILFFNQQEKKLEKKEKEQKQKKKK